MAYNNRMSYTIIGQNFREIIGQCSALNVSMFDSSTPAGRILPDPSKNITKMSILLQFNQLVEAQYCDESN